MTLGATLLTIWTLSITAWSLRKRRYSWESQWERGTNIAIWFIGLTALFDASIVGVPGLDYLPQDWETLLGSLFAVMAASSFNVVAAHRAFPDPRTYLRKVHIKSATGFWLLVVTFLTGELWKPGKLDYHKMMESGGQLYWLTFNLTMGTILASTAAVIFTMCKSDPRHCPSGKAYIASCLIGITGCIAGVISVTTNIEYVDQISTFLFAMWSVTFCITSAFSWKQKMRGYETLTQAVGQGVQWQTLTGSSLHAGSRE